MGGDATPPSGILLKLWPVAGARRPAAPQREAAAGRPQPAADERAGRVPLDVATVSFGATHLLAVALPPMARPGWSTWARPRDRRSATEHGRGRPDRGVLRCGRRPAPRAADRAAATASGHGGDARHRPDGALSALPFEALSDGCGKRLAGRLPRDRNALIRRRARTLGPAMRRTRRGLQPLPSKWSARRKVSATIVNVGFILPAVGNTELPAT